jgi:hypothetical protein
VFKLIRRMIRSLADDFRRATAYNVLSLRYQAYTRIKPDAYGSNLAIVDAYRYVGYSGAVHYSLARHGDAARTHRINGLAVIPPNLARDLSPSDQAGPRLRRAPWAATPEVQQ